MLAQAETMAQAATDLVSARDVVPFMGAAIALLLGAVVYLYRAREQDRRDEKARTDKIIHDLTNKPGDSHA